MTKLSDRVGHSHRSRSYFSRRILCIKMLAIIQQALDAERNEALEEAVEIVVQEREKDFPDLRTARDNIRALKRKPEETRKP